MFRGCCPNDLDLVKVEKKGLDDEPEEIYLVSVHSLNEG
jgi:hypothetical protein